MHVPADRLIKIQELYSESFTFAIDSKLPQTVLGQCIVSYRKFIDSLMYKHGISILEAAPSIQVNTALKANYRDKVSFGLTISCSSIAEAIKVTKLALKRSAGDCFSAYIKLDSKTFPYPITQYIAESKKSTLRRDCQILQFRPVSFIK